MAAVTEIKDNEFNADLKRKNSMEPDMEAKPRNSSFKDADNFVRTKSGTFVRQNSDSHSPIQSRSGTGSNNSTTGMPDFRASIKAQLQKTKDSMPKGLMLEVMETYKPHILSEYMLLIHSAKNEFFYQSNFLEKSISKSVQYSNDVQI